MGKPLQETIRPPIVYSIPSSIPENQARTSSATGRNGCYNMGRSKLDHRTGW
jgi:hypothetical protein